MIHGCLDLPGLNGFVGEFSILLGAFGSTAYLTPWIAGVAAVITGAWEAAGKPPVPVEAPRLPQRRRR